MIVRILGTAAGGGFPQWNCGCPNCDGFRKGRIRATPLTQSQVALSEDGSLWHLLNASPDLRQQLLNHPDMQPTAGPRNSPLRSVLFTNADIDHTLGLLLLRESQPLDVYATESVARLLREGNAYYNMLNQFEGQTRWHIIADGEAFAFTGSALRGRALDLDGKAPYWARQFPASGGLVTGVLIDSPSGKRLGYFPGVGEINGRLLDALGGCDLILFDGTFWDDLELVRLRPGSRTAKQMQHVPMSGEGGSLERLSALGARKIFVHINNTNPVLDPDSQEARQVRDAGWEIATDGMEIHL